MEKYLNPHPKSASHHWISEPLQEVTTDLMGPISLTVLRNSSYIAKFTDVYSRFSVIYFLKSKSSSSALYSFITFERDHAISLFGRRVQCLMSDQATEYTKRALKECLSQNNRSD